MKIDKASFLLLAGAISTGACIVTTSGSDDDGGGGDGTGANTTTSSDGGSDGGSGGALGGAGGMGGDMSAGGNGGAPCDDSAGTSAECSLAMTSCVEGVAILDDITLCNVAADYFKPGVAESATECIVALDSGAGCDAVLSCRNDALALACEDDVSIECAALVQECGTGVGAIDQVECEGLLAGFSDAGRTAVSTQCGPAVEGCLQGGVYLTLGECVDNMLPAN